MIGVAAARSAEIVWGAGADGGAAGEGEGAEETKISVDVLATAGALSGIEEDGRAGGVGEDDEDAEGTEAAESPSAGRGVNLGMGRAESRGGCLGIGIAESRRGRAAGFSTGAAATALTADSVERFASGGFAERL